MSSKKIVLTAPFATVEDVEAQIALEESRTTTGARRNFGKLVASRTSMPRAKISAERVERKLRP